MKLRNLIDSRYQVQQDYLGAGRSEMHNYEAMLKLTSYIVEETVEINRELRSHYKPFKQPQPVDYDKLSEEIADLLIYACGLASIVCDSGRDMEEVIKRKLKKNETRDDHTH